MVFGGEDMRKCFVILIMFFMLSNVILAAELTLPTIADVLKQESLITNIFWGGYYAELGLEGMGKPVEKDKSVIHTWSDIYAVVNKMDENNSKDGEMPFVYKYKTEIINFLVMGNKSLSENRFFLYSIKESFPIHFIKFKEKTCVLVYKYNMLSTFNTIRLNGLERAKTATISNVLPCINALGEAFKNSDFEYYGVIITYGVRNFLDKNSMPAGESVCVIASKENITKYTNLEITDTELLALSDVYSNCDDSTTSFFNGGKSFRKIDLK